MKPYLINDLKNDEYVAIVTLLDYQIQISRCLKTIKISPINSGKVLIDTILCSGMNEYRFIETDLNEDGSINLNKYKYVSVNNNVLKKANNIIKQYPIFLNNSVLPESQIKKIAQC